MPENDPQNPTAPESTPPQEGNDLIAAVRALAQHSEEAAVAALLEHAQPVYQAVFKTGHGVGQQQEANKQKGTTDQLTTAQNRAKDLERQLGELRANAPEKDRQIADYQRQVEDLQGQIKHIEEAHKKEKRESQVEATFRALKSKLTSRNLREKTASLEILNPAVRALFQFNEDGSAYTIYQDSPNGPLSIPLAVAPGKDPLDVLADQMVARAEPEDIVHKGDVGSGQGSGAGAAPTFRRPGSQESQLEAYKRKLADERQQQQKDRPSLEQRLGIA